MSLGRRNSDTPDVSGKAVWRRLHFGCGNMYLAERGGKVEGSRSRALVRRAEWTGNSDVWHNVGGCFMDYGQEQNGAVEDEERS